MGGVRKITQKALHGLSGARQVSMQEAVHLVDDQDLVICSDTFTTLSLRQGALMTGKDDDKAVDIVSMYRNRSPELRDLSMDEYFYSHFCKNILKDGIDDTERTKHRILIPKGQNFRPQYPVTYEYAKGIIIQHMPWSKENPPTKLLRSKSKTIRKFNRMIDNQQLPSSVVSQYICAMKYKNQKKLEMIAAKGTEQPFNLENMDEEDRERYIAHQHVSHYQDNRILNNEIDGMTVDIGTHFDWSARTFKEDCDKAVNGFDFVPSIQQIHEDAMSRQASSAGNLVIPLQKDGKAYSVKGNAEQEEIVYTAVDTIIKFLNNDPSYKPMRATIMGCGGTGKSHIINTIIGMVRQLTGSNNTVQIAAPSGAAAFNVQGSTLHSLLNIGVQNPEEDLSEKRKDKLKAQLLRLLILIIDERSMISSKVLAAAERNTRLCIFNGQNSTELWGGLPVVLLFGDDYQLMPVSKDGAIHGYSKRLGKANEHRTNTLARPLTFSYRGDWLFTKVMCENVYFLTKNYRVKCEQFKKLLERVRVGRPTDEDAHHMMKLHHHFYRLDAKFKDKIENHKKTMWLFSKVQQVQNKNRDMLVETSKKNQVPVAKLDCWYDTFKTQNGKERHAIMSHFDSKSYIHHTALCIGARVALRNWNILPSAGLYSGAIGNVVEIVYKNSVVGPNDKQHDHLPDFIVVDFPHLNLPPNMRPWDLKHPTVSTQQKPLTCALTLHFLSSLQYPFFLGCQHVPIPMKVSKCRKGCCTVKWCPLVTSWATTIHKFQGFEAGEDKKDMFRYLICDPGDLSWEQSCPGALYVALSRARTMGKFRSGNKYTKKSVIYWHGGGMTEDRILEGSKKNNPTKGGPKLKCELIIKRDRWVKHLREQHDSRIPKTFSETEIEQFNKRKFTQAAVQHRIANMITDPNETWLSLKTNEYLTPQTYFGTYD